MSDPTVTALVGTDRSNRLSILADEITEAHQAAETATQTSLHQAKKAGLKLLEAKGLLRHGEWIPWLRSIHLPERTAQRYLQVAKLLPAKYATVSHLGLAGALEAVAKARQMHPDPAAQRGQPTRDGPDFWPTPNSLITALVQHVLPDLPRAAIWECAAGDGRLASAIVAAGRRVIATDLYPQDGSAALDFLIDDPPAEALRSIVITNPPFNKSDSFLDRGQALIEAGTIEGLVLLLRHDHLMAKSRIDAFNRAVREVHCNWRPIWIDETDGNPRWSFHWLAWHCGPRKPPLYLGEQSLLSRVSGDPTP